MSAGTSEFADLFKQGRPATTGRKVDLSARLVNAGEDPPAFTDPAAERAWLFPRRKLGASHRREVVVVNVYDRIRPTRYECRRTWECDNDGFRTYDPRFFVFDNHWGRSIAALDSEAAVHAQVAERNRLYRKEVAMYDGRWSGRIADLYRAQRRLALLLDTEDRLRDAATIAGERGIHVADDIDATIRAKLRGEQARARVAHREAELALLGELHTRLARWGTPYRTSSVLHYHWRIEGTLLALVRRPRRDEPDDTPVAIVTQRRYYRPRHTRYPSVPLAAERAVDLMPYLDPDEAEGRQRLYLLGDDELNFDYYNAYGLRARLHEARETMGRIAERRARASG